MELVCLARLTVLILILSLCDGLPTDDTTITFNGDQVWRIVPKFHRDIRFLQRLEEDVRYEIDFWKQPFNVGHSVDIHVPSWNLKTVGSKISEWGLTYEVIINNLQRVIDDERESQETVRNRRAVDALHWQRVDHLQEREDGHYHKTNSFQQRALNSDTSESNYNIYENETTTDDWSEFDNASKPIDLEALAEFITTYNNHDEINAWLDNIATVCGERCSLHTIGYTGEGRALNVIKIGGLKDRNRSAIWIDAGIHAREWISPATAINVIYKLVMDFKTDRCTRHLLEAYDWYILPVVNPDGYQYSMTRNRMWRKNRRTTDVDRRNSAWWFSYYSSPRYCYGVDLNRNFGYFWGETGTSKNPCSDVYGGPEAFSEPESQAMRSFIETIPSLRIYISLHSYGQYWMYSWGYTRVQADDHRELDRLGKHAARAILEVSGRRSKYEVGSASRTLYSSSGASDDWAKGSMGVKYSFTVELPPSDLELRGNGFILPAPEIPRVAHETWPGIQATAIRALRSDKTGHRHHQVCLPLGEDSEQETSRRRYRQRRS